MCQHVKEYALSALYICDVIRYICDIFLIQLAGLERNTAFINNLIAVSDLGLNIFYS